MSSYRNPAFEESMVSGEWNVECELYPDIVFHSYSLPRDEQKKEKKEQQDQQDQQRRSSSGMQQKQQKQQQQKHLDQQRRSSLHVSPSVATHGTGRRSSVNNNNRGGRPAAAENPLDQSSSSTFSTRWTGANDIVADPLEDLLVLDKSASKFSVAGPTFMHASSSSSERAAS
eukprot:scaffold132293_cov37-Attheya_sp.AAC.1